LPSLKVGEAGGTLDRRLSVFAALDGVRRDVGLINKDEGLPAAAGFGGDCNT
jgi:hypothetical protein